MTELTDLAKVFDEKYTEFCQKLEGLFPELSGHISQALALTKEVRLKSFEEEIVPGCSPTRDASKNPGKILPGLELSEALWSSIGEGSKKAIQEYLTLLSMCCLYNSSRHTFDLSGAEQMFSGLGNIDFESMSKKFGDMFGSMSPDKMPKIPERFLKGHLAKLAEELVREFKPEDFGLNTEELKACDTDPARAFTLLTDIYTKKPEILQKAIQRIGNRLQEKVKKGEIRPEQIAAEAEELIKEFSGNGAFVEMMESFRSVFGMEDPDLAREVGRDGDARRNIVRERLRKKMEAKKAAKK